MGKSTKQTLASNVRQWLPPVLLPYAHAIDKTLRPVDPRLLKLREAFEALNRDTPANELTLRENLRLAVHPDSRFAFEYFCWRSVEMVDEMDAFLSFTKGAQRLLDVGALHGIFSLVFAKQDASRRAVSVDPSPLAFAKLLYNIHANKLGGQVAAVECALSDSEGSIAMRYEWEHAVAAPLTPHDKLGATFQKTTGDGLCNKLGFIPDIIKIDVEGHEVKAIRGLATVIHAAKPTLFLEVHPDRIRAEHDSLRNVLSWLEEEGYYASDSSGTALDMQTLCEAASDVRVMLRIGAS
jgi:FkbM family methyltransferase